MSVMTVTHSEICPNCWFAETEVFNGPGIDYYSRLYRTKVELRWCWCCGSPFVRVVGKALELGESTQL